MTRREAVLVKVLAGVLAAAAVGTGFALQLQRRADARARIAAMTTELAKLRERDADVADLSRQHAVLSAETALEQERFYREREMDTYRFGAIVRTLLIGEGLAISRYRTLESSGRTFLEFTVSGSALGLSRFLRHVTESDHVWVVPSLSIDSRGTAGEVRSVFRIGYETIAAVAR